jgi:hypothetical protein
LFFSNSCKYTPVKTSLSCIYTGGFKENCKSLAELTRVTSGRNWAALANGICRFLGNKSMGNMTVVIISIALFYGIFLGQAFRMKSQMERRRSS